MDINNINNQSYWFVFREDQSNVIFSSNNFTIQNPQITGQEAKYVVEPSDNQHFIEINEVPVIVQDNTGVKEFSKVKSDDNLWDRNKIKILLTLCLENGFRNPIKDKTIWADIAVQIGASPDECSKKYRNLRRTYIRLLKKKRSGKEIKWVHYNICEEVFKECKSLPPSILEPWEDHKVRRLLSLYIENLSRFRNPDSLQKDIWKEIANEIGTTEYNCYHKFKNLKRTYFNWLDRSRQTGKLIKWSYHQYFERIFYNYNPAVGPWDRNKIKQLLEAYTRIAHKFKNPRFQKKELWKEISTSVGESPSKCDRKYRNLKQTYIRLKMKSDTGIVTKWRYFKDFENIYNAPTNYNIDGAQKLPYSKYHEEDYVKRLLSFYIEHKEKFKDPLTKKKNVWRLIAPKLGLSSDECDRKFRNLKQTYIRLVEKKTETGRCNRWPYYSYFEKIFGHPKVNKIYHQGVNLDSMTLSEIRRAFQQGKQKEESDKFDKLVGAIQESNDIQRERNCILQALLNRK